VAEYGLAMPVTFEQIVAVIRQMSSADHRRLLDLVPELRQAVQSVATGSQKAWPGHKPPTLSASKSSSTFGQYDEDAGPGLSPRSPGMVQGGLEIGTDQMGDLSRTKWRDP